MNDKEFNEKDKLFNKKLEFLHHSVSDAENLATVVIDNKEYPTSNIWRDIALTALQLADLSDWFDRYEKANRKDKF